MLGALALFENCKSTTKEKATIDRAVLAWTLLYVHRQGIENKSLTNPEFMRERERETERERERDKDPSWNLEAD